MTVRCRFVCRKVVKEQSFNRANPSPFVYTAKFTVVVGDTEENEKFFDATPAGLLEIGTFKDDVFEVGKTYTVDLTPVE